jgi:hypothetical protein
MQNFKSCVFFLDFVHIYTIAFIPAVIQGWAQPRWVVTLLLLGCTGGGGDRVRIVPRTGHDNHWARIKPSTEHQQYSVLTTELHHTVSNFTRHGQPDTVFPHVILKVGIFRHKECQYIYVFT